MSDASIQQSGGDFTSINAFIADAGTSGGDTGTISGTWSAADTTSVTWNKAVIIVATGGSVQIGKPWVSGGTEYRHVEPTEGAGGEHAFTVTANVDITGINIQSSCVGVSDELFHATGAYGCVITNCQLGFSGGNVDQQDVWYTEDYSTKTLSFVQCFFYDVGRSVVDLITGTQNGTVTINFNSCGSFNIGANGARNDGSWVGSGSTNTGDTINVNAHNCLMSINDTQCFDTTSSGPAVLNVDCTYSIASVATTAISNTEASEDLTGTVGSRTWAAATAGGDEVLLTNITSGTYDPALVDDSTNNDAQTFHATVTDAGLTIPDLDILGQTRDKATPSFDCGPSALTLAAGGGGGAAQPRHRTMNLMGISA